MINNLDPEKVIRALDAELGSPDSMANGERDYRCCFCVRTGKSKQSHLHVNISKGVSLCHGCGFGSKSLSTLLLGVFGRIPTGVTTRRNMDTSMVDEIENILFGKRDTATAKDEIAAVSLPEGFVPLTEKPSTRLGKVVYDYLVTERGVPYRRLADIGAGYCASGSMQGYAIFPVHVNGVLLTYTSRRVVGIGPKVRHAKVGRSASLALFNYDQAATADRLFIGEGPFDAFALHRRLDRKDAAVATLGTLIHDAQARLIGELPCSSVYVWYDSDAMDKATAVATLIKNVTGKKTFVVRHKDKDPDELPEETLALLVEKAESCSFLSSIKALTG